MFQKIRYRFLMQSLMGETPKTALHRLFISNLLVLALVLLGSALAVRIVFISNLKQQANEKLMAIAQSTAVSAEVDEGEFEWEIEFPPQLLEEAQQAFQWFDTQGKLLKQQGNTRYISTLDFKAEPTAQTQIDETGLEVITLPILDKNNQRLIGYLRASQSLEKVDETIERLDVGLAVGAIVAAILSSLGSGWLNHQAMQPIEESFQRLKQFTADASHELRSPFNGNQHQCRSGSNLSKRNTKERWREILGDRDGNRANVSAYRRLIAPDTH